MYTTQIRLVRRIFPQFHPRYFNNFVFNMGRRRSLCWCRTVGTERRPHTQLPTDRFVCANKESPCACIHRASNSKTTSSCLLFTSHTRVRARPLERRRTNGKMLARSLPLPPASYFSAPPLPTCFRSSDSHTFFGIMRSFFYGRLLSVVCFST